MKWKSLFRGLLKGVNASAKVAEAVAPAISTANPKLGSIIGQAGSLVDQVIPDSQDKKEEGEDKQ